MTDANHPGAGPDETPSIGAPSIEAPTQTPPTPPDLATIEHDLTAVEAALAALDDGSYWVDEVTGEPIPDDVLATNPLARRA